MAGKSIPPELANPPNLKSIRLSDNRFVGCIPVALRDVYLRNFLGSDLDRLDMPCCRE